MSELYRVGDLISNKKYAKGIIKEIKNIPWGFRYVVEITKGARFAQLGSIEEYRFEDIKLLNPVENEEIKNYIYVREWIKDSIVKRIGFFNFKGLNIEVYKESDYILFIYNEVVLVRYLSNVNGLKYQKDYFINICKDKKIGKVYINNYYKEEIRISNLKI